MSNFSFSKTEEVKQTVGVKASTGIHEFKIVSVDIIEIKGKDGNPDWEKGQLNLVCTKTIEGKDSVGKTMNYDILYPKDEEGAEKLGKRLMHILSKVSTKDKIETVKDSIKKLDLTSIKSLMNGIKKIVENRSLRLKIVANREGKYPTIPLYYSGYAETIDTNPSELRYDANKEGIKTAPTNTESVVEDFEMVDDLPF